MESALRSSHDLDDDDEDMESFLKTIKLHDRFADEYYNEDGESFSDDELNADGNNLQSLRKGCCSKQEDYHSILSSEAKAEAISMLDTVRSSCQKSGRSFSLLNLKSDESGLGDHGGTLFGESFHRRCPPFGDPLSEDDILNSALKLLDNEQCKKFREVGLFDGFVVKGNIVADSEKLPDVSFASFTDCFSDHRVALTPLMQPKTPEKPTHNSWNMLTSMPKSEEASDIDILPPSKPELSEIISQNPETTKEQSISKENMKCCGSDIDVFTHDDSHVSTDAVGVAIVKTSNQRPKKKTRGKKGNANSAPSNNAKNSKISPAKKSELAPDSQTEKFDLDIVEKDDHVKIVDGFCQREDCANSTLGSIAIVQEVALSDFGFIEDEGMCEEFKVVLNKRKSRTQKEVHNLVDLGDELLKDKHGVHSRFSPALALNVASRPLPKSSGNNVGMLSKHSSRSSTAESLNFVSDASARSERQGLCDHLLRPSYSSPSKTHAPNSYATVVSQNLPQLSIRASVEVAGFSVKEDLDIHNVELETAGLLSPPQSEADTGFSSASSLSPDEMHADSLAHDGTESNLAEISSLSFTSEKEKEKRKDQSTAPHKIVIQDGTSSDNLKLNLLPNTIPQASTERCELEITPYEKSIAYSNQLQVTQHRKSAIFFDTRNPEVPDSAAFSEIVFGFDSGDEFIDVGTDSYTTGDIPHPHENLIDLKDITFFAGSADGLSDLLNVLSPKTSYGVARDNTDNTRAEDNNDFKLSVGMSHINGSFHLASAKPENVEKSVDDNSDIRDNCGCQRECLEEICASGENRSKDLCIKNSNLSSGDDFGAGDAKVRSSCSKFDLRAAQKFLSKAFDSILKQGSESTKKVVRF